MFTPPALDTGAGGCFFGGGGEGEKALGIRHWASGIGRAEGILGVGGLEGDLVAAGWGFGVEGEVFFDAGLERVACVGFGVGEYDAGL